MPNADELALRLARRTRELEIVGSIAAEINSTLDLDVIFGKVLASLCTGPA
jgi:hypothetical protein